MVLHRDLLGDDWEVEDSFERICKDMAATDHTKDYDTYYGYNRYLEFRARCIKLLNAK